MSKPISPSQYLEYIWYQNTYGTIVDIYNMRTDPILISGWELHTDDLQLGHVGASFHRSKKLSCGMTPGENGSGRNFTSILVNLLLD